MELAALLNKMIIFIALMVIGYVLARRGLFGPDFTKTASSLVLNVFMVGTILSSMISTGAEHDIRDLAHILFLTFVMTAFGYVVSAVAVRLMPMEKDLKAPAEILMAAGNNMFIALPIAEAIYGSYAVFIVSVSCIPFNMLLYSYGVWRLKGSGEGKGLRIREMFSIPLIATLFGMLLILLRVPLPQAVRGLLSSLSGATMPMSMMVIGASLGSVSLLDAFRKPIFVFTSAVRLLLIPALSFFVLRPLTDDTALLMTNVIVAGAPSAVLCSVLAIQYGRDGVFSSEGVQHSTVCSMLTLPLIISVFSRLV
ncbi:MAG: AEC family transporter [Candidatus Limivicinus sp.]